MEIKFYDCNPETLEAVYADYVKKVKDDHNCCICTNVLCVVNYIKPKINNGRPTEYVKTDYKIMTSTLLIKWNDGTCYDDQKPFTQFIFGNISNSSVIKFAKMEDIDWIQI